jgi:hypothetical protein
LQVFYYSKERIERLILSTINAIILLLLIAPVYILARITTGGSSSGGISSNTINLSVGLLLIFTLFFNALLFFFTRARLHEILGASAA